MPKFTTLEIKRNPHYATVRPDQLVGLVTITEEGEGQHSISLSPDTLVKILRIIQTDVVNQMQVAARTAPLALSTGIAEIELASNPLLPQE